MTIVTSNSAATERDGKDRIHPVESYFKVRYGNERASRGKIILSRPFDDHNHEMYRHVSDELLQSAPRATMLWNAYQELSHIQRSLVPDKAKARDAINHLVRTLKNYPHLYEIFFETNYGINYSRKESLLLRQTGIFHEMAGEGKVRKHTGNRAVHHSYRVTNNAQAHSIIAFHRLLPIRYIISILLHDNKEDFRTTLDQIRLFCGQGVARNVHPVTIPENDELEKLFPNVVAKWTIDEQKKKATLKHLYKMYSAPSYSFINILTKFWDGIDIIDSYYREIRDGRIYVADIDKNTKLQGEIPVFSREWLRRNLKERFVFNQLMVGRLIEIRNDEYMNSEKFDCLRLVNDIACIFALNSQKLIKAAGFRAPELLELQTNYANDYLKNPQKYERGRRRLEFPQAFYGKMPNGTHCQRKYSEKPDNLDLTVKHHSEPFRLATLPLYTLSGLFT